MGIVLEQTALALALKQTVRAHSHLPQALAATRLNARKTAHTQNQMALLRPEEPLPDASGVRASASSAHSGNKPQSLTTAGAGRGIAQHERRLDRVTPFIAPPSLRLRSPAYSSDRLSGTDRTTAPFATRLASKPMLSPDHDR